MAILSVSGVRKSFGGLEVLNGVDMSLDAGRVYQLIGPNGSGKTTLINVISGALRATAGSVTFEGAETTGMTMLQTRRLGVSRTFQIPQSFEKLTTLENALVATGENSGESYRRAPLHALWRADEERAVATAQDALEKSGILGKQFVESQELSGGQRKLLELAKSIAGDAKLILMDEPIAGVNPKIAHEIFKMIRGMAAGGVTFLIIEHRLDISLEYADHVFAMDKGRIVAEGSAKDVIADERVVESYLGK